MRVTCIFTQPAQKRLSSPNVDMKSELDCIMLATKGRLKLALGSARRAQPQSERRNPGVKDAFPETERRTPE